MHITKNVAVFSRSYLLCQRCFGVCVVARNALVTLIFQYYMLNLYSPKNGLACRQSKVTECGPNSVEVNSMCGEFPGGRKSMIGNLLCAHHGKRSEISKETTVPNSRPVKTSNATSTTQSNPVSVNPTLSKPKVAQKGPRAPKDTRRKNLSGKLTRPLFAYNLFYRDERVKWLAEIAQDVQSEE